MKEADDRPAQRMVPCQHVANARRKRQDPLRGEGGGCRPVGRRGQRQRPVRDLALRFGALGAARECLDGRARGALDDPSIPLDLGCPPVEPPHRDRDGYRRLRTVALRDGTLARRITADARFASSALSKPATAV